MSDAAAELWLADEDATVALGVALGRRLAAGDVVALHGELGAGKTALVRGLARGLGVDHPEDVCSPTYLLVVEHPGPVPLLHVDAYFPDKLRGFLADGGLDYLAQGDAVVVVEWAERVGDLMPPPALRVTLRAARRQGVDGRLAALDNAARPELVAGLGVRPGGNHDQP